MRWTQIINEFPSKTAPAIVGELYGTHYSPYFVLIDKKEKIVIASLDEHALTKKIEETLSN